MLGLKEEIRAKGKLRLKIKKLGDKVWEEDCQNGDTPKIDPYKKEIKYNNEQLHSELLPKYNKMLEIFRNNYWLAEPKTREFYHLLLEFVEIWNRSVSDGIPLEVLKKINHTEKNLEPFYEELENRVDELRSQLLKIS